MMDFTPQNIVLVTGANGHLAQHVVHQLLARPASSRPTVRATTRSSTSAAALRSTFASHVSAGTLQLVHIADLTSVSALTAVFINVTHIAHIASPLVVQPTEVENDLLKPAIQGTTALLTAAHQSCSTLEAVVITSSLASVFDVSQGARKGYTYTSKDWNPITYAEAADRNLDLSQFPARYRPFVTYAASKKLAEEAAWEFYAEHKPSWRLVVVLPGYIAGPYVLPLTKGVEGVSYSVGLVWRTVRSQPGEKLTELDFVNWVDVRDAADVHVRALLVEGAGGKRLLVGPLRVAYSDMTRIVREEYGWETSEEVQRIEQGEVSNKETEEVLGIKEWRPLKEMVLDTVEQLQAFDV
jgi:nucleoside-diphosphate-sugar epimerase